MVLRRILAGLTLVTCTAVVTGEVLASSVAIPSKTLESKISAAALLGQPFFVTSKSQAAMHYQVGPSWNWKPEVVDVSFIGNHLQFLVRLPARIEMFLSSGLFLVVQDVDRWAQPKVFFVHVDVRKDRVLRRGQALLRARVEVENDELPQAAIYSPAADCTCQGCEDCEGQQRTDDSHCEVCEKIGFCPACDEAFERGSRYIMQVVSIGNRGIDWIGSQGLYDFTGTVTWTVFPHKRASKDFPANGECLVASPATSLADLL